MNIVITGASKGIGKAIAEQFASQGHQLLLCSRSEFTLYKTLEELNTRYPSSNVRGMPCDLSIPAETEKFSKWCLESGTPDILINNAGSFEPGNTFDEPDGALQRQINTNLYSAYQLTRALLPAMIKNKKGHVFNMCSIASLKAYPNGGAYSISKFALYGFTQNLREEMKPYGIRVTAVIPGAVMTDSWSGFDNSGKRIMEAGDIAKMVVAAAGLSFQACVEDIVIRPLLGDL